METNIIRLNYFDGYFLDKDDFLAEQDYQVHMRRRMNYMLFSGNGVVQVEPTDLRVTSAGVPADKTFTVTAGMAVSRRTDVREGREIILREDTASIDLVTEGFSAGQTAHVAIHYEEETKDPQTIATPNEDTRVEEHARITTHGTWPPLTPPPGPPSGESFIRLGVIDFDSMAVTEDAANRETAFLRSGLLSAVPSPTGPNITGISPTNGAPGDTVNAVITGANLTGTTVTVTPAADVVVTVGTITPSSIDVTLVLGAAAATGSRLITVTDGTNSDSISFLISGVISPPVTITQFTPTLATVSATLSAPLQVNGTNMHDAALTGGDPAVGTVVRLVTVADPTVVVATLLNPIVQNIGTGQRLTATLPFRPAFLSEPSTVRVQVEFGGSTGTSPAAPPLTIFYL